MSNQETKEQSKPDQPRRRAGAYVRMSTDLQQYSTDNQMAVIERYAAENDMELVATYSDEARSGLRYENRPGMQQMLADAQRADAGFDAILVYDISRWGRFQDQDEAAALEFECRKARVQVHYCMDQFVNDGSPMSTVMKSLGRYMAADYSSKLSEKVFAGQCRLIERGFRQGGMAGYGLRQMRIDQNGEPQGILDWGQRKSLQTDRVILVPGPEEEVETVRWMYREFIDGGRLEGEIAATLNEKGIATDLDRPWTRGTVQQVLTNEKYIGNNIFNRHSYKLKGEHKDNPPEEWVRADGAFEAVVDAPLFFTAQGMIRERNHRFVGGGRQAEVHRRACVQPVEAGHQPQRVVGARRVNPVASLGQRTGQAHLGPVDGECAMALPPSIGAVVAKDLAVQIEEQVLVDLCPSLADRRGGDGLALRQGDAELAALIPQLGEDGGIGLAPARQDETEHEQHDDQAVEDPFALHPLAIVRGGKCCFACSLTSDFPDCLTQSVSGFPTLFGLFRSDGRALTVSDGGASALSGWG